MNHVITRKLSEFCEITSGGTPSRDRLNEYFGGSIPWVKSGELEDAPISKTEETLTELGLKNSSAKYFPKNTVLVALYGATVGKTGILEIEATTNQAVAGIVPAKDVADHKYLFHFLRFYAPTLVAARVGGAQPNISQGILKNIDVPLPPLHIQKQIAAILEKADAAREKRRQANQLTEQFLQSAFLEMFGDPLKSSIVKKRVLVGDILESYQYGLSVALSGDSSPSDGLPILRIANITGQGYIDYSDLKYHRVGKKREETLLLKRGDLLFNWRNSPKWVGKTAIFNGEGDFIFASFLLRLRIKEELVNKVFFWYWVNYLRAKGVFQSKCRQAVNQASFNGFDLERIEMICPPLSDQQKFAALVEKVESLRAKQRESERELEELFNSLLQRAFRGELVG